MNAGTRFALVTGGSRGIGRGIALELAKGVFNGLPHAVQDTSRRGHESGWTPMGRLGTPADIGKAVALLCSEGAAWITGQVINVDGGASLMDTVFPLEIQRG
jgi:enoyl-[acyl-carrier protein] reductase III